MDLYRATFAGSLLLNSFVLFQAYRSREIPVPESAGAEKAEHRGRVESDTESLRKLKWRFFPIYLLVNAADWLQGPYIYPIYKGKSSAKLGDRSREATG
jgi:hypothetical protein